MKRKLKKLVLPSIYALVIAISLFSVIKLNNLMTIDNNDYNYSKSVMKDVTQIVLKSEESKYLKPFVNENVNLQIGYYGKEASEEEQQKSLIFYENTYMPSTGNFYVSDDVFDVIAVYDGVVKKVYTDEILGNVVEVSHNTNLSTFYYSLSDVAVKENDQLSSGTILGKSTTNKIINDRNTLLFEVYYQGKSINPEEFYQMDPKDLV